MGRVDKYRQLRYQLIEERDNFKTIYGEVIEHNLDIINDKLDDISSTLEELSKHLYEIAKCDNHEYSKIFDEQMGKPIEQLDKLFEVKKCQ